MCVWVGGLLGVTGCVSYVSVCGVLTGGGWTENEGQRPPTDSRSVSPVYICIVDQRITYVMAWGMTRNDAPLLSI